MVDNNTVEEQDANDHFSEWCADAGFHPGDPLARKAYDMEMRDREAALGASPQPPEGG